MLATFSAWSLMLKVSKNACPSDIGLYDVAAITCVPQL